jgi:hypothetical protein
MGWSADSGSRTSGTPAASAASVVPAPPWATIAAACGITLACATQRSTCTLAGSDPSSAGSAWRPTVTSTRAGTPASASITSRYRPGKWPSVGTAVPKDTGTSGAEASFHQAAGGPAERGAGTR